MKEEEKNVHANERNRKRNVATVLKNVNIRCLVSITAAHANTASKLGFGGIICSLCVQSGNGDSVYLISKTT